MALVRERPTWLRIASARHVFGLRAPDLSQGERDDTAAYAKGRSYRIYRYNTFHHVGHISTLAQPTNRFNPGCYSLLYDWLLPAEVSHEKHLP